MDRFSRTHLQRRVRKLSATIHAARPMQSVDYRLRFDLAEQLLDAANTLLSPLPEDDYSYRRSLSDTADALQLYYPVSTLG